MASSGAASLNPVQEILVGFQRLQCLCGAAPFALSGCLCQTGSRLRRIDVTSSKACFFAMRDGVVAEPVAKPSRMEVVAVNASKRLKPERLAMPIHSTEQPQRC